MKTKLIQKGNSKLHNMYMFNIPASKAICNTICKGCYAHKEQTRFKSVLEARQRRFDASKSVDFPTTINNELSKLRNKPKYFRVHASGDFYSQPYIDAWHQIALANPSITFYAYTKRLSDFNFTSLASLPNFVLINSKQFGNINYGTLDEAPTGAFICPSYTGATCGQSCTYCMTKTAQTNGVWFKKH